MLPGRRTLLSAGTRMQGDQMSSDGASVRTSRFSTFLIFLAAIGLVACAGPEPILKSTTYLQIHGKDQAEREAAVCGLKAERAGLQHGTNRSGNAGAGAALGVIGGAAVGASTGLIGGPTGIAIGAAAGGAVGAVLGLLAGAYKPLQPQQDYAAFVERCLKEKGYETDGWQ